MTPTNKYCRTRDHFSIVLRNRQKIICYQTIQTKKKFSAFLKNAINDKNSIFFPHIIPHVFFAFPLFFPWNYELSHLYHYSKGLADSKYYSKVFIITERRKFEIYRGKFGDNVMAPAQLQ